MTNPYYNPTSAPSDHSFGRASSVRSEFSSVGNGFDAVKTAIDAVFAGGGLSSTSASSLTVGTGTKSLTVGANLSFAPGQYLLIASTAAPTTNYMEGRCNSYSSATGALSLSASVSAGSGTFSSWVVSLQGQPAVSGITIRSISSADTLIASDLGKLIDVTSGTFTLGFSACATLGASWWCYLRNAGSGAVALDPSGAETIDGLTTFTMYPGETRLVHCDGATLRSIVLTGFRYKFAATAEIYIPPGYTAFGHKVVSASGGGGAGGRYASGTTSWGGVAGGGAGVHVGTTTGATAGGVLTVAVGAKGVGGASVTTNDTYGNWGTDGGASSLSGGGFNISVAGGKGGQGGWSSAPTGAYGGGVGASYVQGLGAVGASFGFNKGLPCGSYAFSAEFGGAGSGGGTLGGVAAAGGATVWGGASGGSGGGYNSSTPVAASAAGTSTYGSAGGAGGAVTVNGSNGTAASDWGGGGGGGGGASQNGTNSGKGGDGVDGFVDLWGVI